MSQFTLIEAGRAQLYPDIGVAAMLRNQWQDVAFRIGSLGDRAIVAPDDEVLILAAPDPQGVSSCQGCILTPCSAVPLWLNILRRRSALSYCG